MRLGNQVCLQYGVNIPFLGSICSILLNWKSEALTTPASCLVEIKKPVLANGLCNFIRAKSGLGFFGFGFFLFALLFSLFLSRSFGGLGFGSGSLRGRRLDGGQIHPFEDGELRGIALALVHLHDARITAVAVFLRR